MKQLAEPESQIELNQTAECFIRVLQSLIFTFDFLQVVQVTEFCTL